MKLATTAVIVVLTTATAVAGSGKATAHPAAGAKPAGTIFYLRAGHGGEHEFAIHPNGRANRRVPNVALDISAVVAPQAHLIAYLVTVGEFGRKLVLANYAGHVVHTYSSDSLIGLVSISPNGKYVGVETAGHTGPFSYKIMSTSGHSLGTLFKVGNKLPVVAESWNASSKDVAVLDAPPTARPKTTLKIFNRHGKVVRTLVKNAGASYAVAWSRSGDIAYSTSAQINVVRHTGGKPRVLLTNDKDPDNGLAYSPNGAFLAYALEAGENGQIWRVDANGTNPQLITRNGTTPAWG